MTQIAYNNTILSNLKYVKIDYVEDDELHEITTEVKSVRNNLIQVYLRSRKDFDIKYPQIVSAKFVAEDCLYAAEITLNNVQRVDNVIYFDLIPPKVMERIQNRKYYRISLKRTCVLIATDKTGRSTVFMSRLVDVSAGGLLIHQLESMFDRSYVNIDPSEYVQYNIVLFLDLDIVLKLSARYIRQEKAEVSNKYAFEFINIKQSDVDTISQYVTKEQVEQLNLRQKLEL